MKVFMITRAVMALVLFSLITTGNPLLSQAKDSTINLPFQQLRGISGVYVDIGFITNSEGNEITEDRIRTDVELRLRTAGIKVLTKEQRFQTPGMPALNIYVSAFTRKELEFIYAYNILVSFAELVKPERVPHSEPILAMTWAHPKTAGLVGRSSLHEIRRQILDQIDEFINALLAANPK